VLYNLYLAQSIGDTVVPMNRHTFKHNAAV